MCIRDRPVHRLARNVGDPDAVRVAAGNGSRQKGGLRRGKEFAAEVRSGLAPVVNFLARQIEPGELAIHHGRGAIEQDVAADGKIPLVARRGELKVRGDGDGLAFEG